jgi:hypothetical protein
MLEYAPLMDDPDVRLGWKVLRAIPNDGSERSYEAVLAIQSLVWELWRLRDELTDGQAERPTA